MRIYILSLIGVLGLIGCAGPTSPFGSINKIDKKHIDLSKAMAPTKGLDIKTYPEYQNLHRMHDLTLKISSPEHKLSSENLNVFYRGKNISNSFLRNANTTLSDQELIFHFKDLSLSPKFEHDITFVYYDKKNELLFEKRFEAPKCSLKQTKLTLNPLNNPLFLKLQLLGQNSDLNEYLMMGLWAASKDQDVGRYPANAPALYEQLFSTEKFQNHLTVKKISHHLDSVNNFWKDKQNRKILTSTFGEKVPELEIFLTSYQNGPEKIKKLIIENRHNWLETRELSGSKAYIRQVNSFCHFFSKNTESEMKYFTNNSL